jgi:hypothetical protein
VLSSSDVILVAEALYMCDRSDLGRGPVVIDTFRSTLQALANTVDPVSQRSKANESHRGWQKEKVVTDLEAGQGLWRVSASKLQSVVAQRVLQRHKERSGESTAERKGGVALFD